MEKIGTILHKDVPILYLDCSYEEPEELQNLLAQLEQTLQEAQEAPLRILINATGMRLNAAAAQTLESLIAKNLKKIWAIAMFGVTEAARSQLPGALRAAQKRMAVFVTRADAKDFLADML